MSRRRIGARRVVFRSRTTGSVSIHDIRRKSLVFSSDSIAIRNTAERASASRSASGWSSATGEESGSNPNREREQPFSSPSRETPSPSARQRFNLLLVEDNLPDALLVREAIRKEGLPIELYRVSDGQQAIDFIERAEEDPEAPCPHFLLLHLNLPKVEGFEI